MKIKITRATLKETIALGKLCKETFKDSFGHTCSLSDMDDFITKFFSKEILSKELADPNDYYFVAYLDQIPVGYVRLKEEYDVFPYIKKYKAMELKRIYVQRDHQSNKIGAKLIQFAINFAQNNNYEVIWLGVWEHNSRAISFYKKWGFENTNYSHKFYIGNSESLDVLYMKLLGEGNI